MEYIDDDGRRKNCQNTRLKGLAKKTNELVTLCGGSVILHYTDKGGNTYIHTSDESVSQNYERQIINGIEPSITFPNVKSMSILDKNGDMTRKAQWKKDKWVVVVRNVAEVEVDPSPVNPSPSKKSKTGDLNYLPTVVRHSTWTSVGPVDPTPGNMLSTLVYVDMEDDNLQVPGTSAMGLPHQQDAAV